jgi:hypothetical protein
MENGNVDREKKALEELEVLVEESIDALWKSAVIVDDFTDTSMQPIFNKKM